MSAQKNAQKSTSDTPGRLLRSCSIDFNLLILEEGVAAAKALEAGKTVRHGFTRSRRSKSAGRLGRGRGCSLAFSGSLAVAAGAVLDVFQNDDRDTALLLGFLILPDVLVISAGQGHDGAFLELHPADALAEGTERLNADIDPSVVLFCSGVVNLGTNTEPNEISLIRELQSRCVVGTFGNGVRAVYTSVLCSRQTDRR